MTNPTISVDLNRSIEVEVGNKTINIVQNSGGTANHVANDVPFYFDGAGGNTYLKYNSTTLKLELWVGGVKQTQWGTEAGGDPF